MRLEEVRSKNKSKGRTDSNSLNHRWKGGRLGGIKEGWMEMRLEEVKS